MGTSIVVCGKSFDVGTKVVLWNEPGGFNAYDTTKYVRNEENRRTGQTERVVVSGRRYSKRNKLVSRPSINKLQETVTQFFLHHSGLYRSKTTFDVLHKERGLSCHFILDDDGTIYQTLDIREKAWHGGVCNSASIGIEIDSRALAGRYPNAYNEYNQRRFGVGPRTSRRDIIHGETVNGYEYNDKQYRALISLAIGLCNIFPIIGTNANFPLDADGSVIKTTLYRPKSHYGFICHFHASSGKIDPIAFDFDRFTNGVRSGSVEVVEVDECTTTAEEEFFEGIGIVLEEPEPDVVCIDSWREIQEALVELGYNPGAVDGIWGKKTKKALRSFQAANMLVIDGIWGSKTKSKMEDLIRGKRNV